MLTCYTKLKGGGEWVIEQELKICNIFSDMAMTKIELHLGS